MPSIKVHHGPTVDEAWDGPAAKANLKLGAEEAYYRSAFAWQSSDANPTTKAAYKYIHHTVSAEGAVGAANLIACATGIGRLNNPASTIPAGDRKGVHAHLAAHLKDAGWEVPTLKSEGKVQRMYAPFEFKAMGEDGTFEGLASVYGNCDLGGDIVMPGAFTKTISENGAKVPLLLEHREPIGISNLEDMSEGLYTRNALNLAKAVARDAYADLKFYWEQGIKMGMSIGYKTINFIADETDSFVRRLTEVRLYENSITLFPMNQLARVQAMKSAEDDVSELIIEIKEGRVFSEANMQRMREILAAHESLMAEHSGLMEKLRVLLNSASAAKSGVSQGASDGPASTTRDEHNQPEPDQIHAALEVLNSLKGEIAWN